MLPPHLGDRAAALRRARIRKGVLVAVLAIVLAMPPMAYGLGDGLVLEETIPVAGGDEGATGAEEEDVQISDDAYDEAISIDS